jgi:hypothetical protein
MNRGEWRRALKAELPHCDEAERAAWRRGIWRLIVLDAVELGIPLAMIAAVVGGIVFDRYVFLEVERSGRSSWIGALALTVPTALVVIAAALLVLSRHRLAWRAAVTSSALIVVCSVISVANLAPVRPFMDDWQHTTTDPLAAHHAAELRFNVAVGALCAAAALLALAWRRRRPIAATI